MYETSHRHLRRAIVAHCFYHLPARPSESSRARRVAMAPRGTLVVFEGLDKAGKSTQCAKLVQNLQAQGHAVSGLRFPGMLLPWASPRSPCN